MKIVEVQEEALAEEAEEAGVEAEEEAVSGLGEILDPKKCIKQLVLSVARNVKFRLNQKKEEKFFAKIALVRRKDIKFFS